MKIFSTLLLVLGFFCSESSAFDYAQWWENWYANGGISGGGSRGVLAQFKADVVNDFLKTHTIHSVIEFGCGDGYNLGLMNYKQYLGFDVSGSAVDLCIAKYKDDANKSFMIYDPKHFINKSLRADLVVCLDVLYHITKEDEFLKVLDDIFSFSAPYVILYTTLHGVGNSPASPEILHRDILPYLKKYSGYEITIERQKHTSLSIAEFVILTRRI